MSPSAWSGIFRLLSVMVLVDERVYQEEVEAFTKACMKLNETISPGMVLTRKTAFDWFLNHRDSLKSQLDQNTLENLIENLARNIDPQIDKLSLLQSLEDISMSDGQQHVREKIILKKLASLWAL